ESCRSKEKGLLDAASRPFSLDPDFFMYPGWQAAPEVECHRASMPETRGCCDVVVVVLLEFGGKLDVYAFCVGDTQEEILTGAMSTGTPEDRYLMPAQVVAPCQQFGTIEDAVAYVIDIHLPLDKGDRVVVSIAAQPDTFAQQPVRDIESQSFGVKVNHLLQVWCL